jgi:DNA-binding CsgD family transcriptional regulator
VNLSNTSGANDIAAFASLVEAVGRDDFGQFFFSFCNEKLGIDSCTVFRFGSEHGPSCILADGGSDSNGRTRTRIAKDVAAEYAAEGYRHCPHGALLRSATDQPITRIYDPDQLGSRDYRRRYYARADVEHELLLAERLKGHVFYVGLYRGSGDKFSAETAALLSLYAPFVLNCLVRHTEVMDTLHPRAIWTRTTTDRIREMLPALCNTLLSDPGHLTRREAEICAWIMVGFSSTAISSGLGISFDTVKTHRKRAYAKLGIGSQNELFTRYVSATLTNPWLDQRRTSQVTSVKSRSGSSDRYRSFGVG